MNEKIIKIVNNIKKSDNYDFSKLYLIELIKKDSGFFLSGGKLLFAAKFNGDSNESINTTYLSLKTDVYIGTVENSPSFNVGYYNLLSYNYEISDKYLDSFIDLCRSFSNNEDYGFTDFFYSLLKLFEPVKEVSFSNCVGLYGELSFIKRMFSSYQINISRERHNCLGSSDKYDFSFGNFNLEIKSTIKNSNIFVIKHSQIFNNSINYIAVINIELDNSGESLIDLYEYFKNSADFNRDIDFMIKIEQERKRVDPSDFKDKKFKVSNVRLFKNDTLETIENIPDCIDSINYNYDFTGKKFLDMKEFSELLH